VELLVVLVRFGVFPPGRGHGFGTRALVAVMMFSVKRSNLCGLAARVAGVVLIW
jgi:hypothetical protein